MDRREEVRDAEDILRKQAYYLSPARWHDLFASDPEPDAMTMAGRPVEEVVEDVDELDAYFSQIDEKRTMTGAQLLDDQEGGWI